MNISGLSNSVLAQTTTNLQREQERTDGFQKALEKAAGEQDNVALKSACVEFETYFLNLMFKEMRKTVNVGETATKKSQTESLFQEMLDEEVAASSAKAGGIGLAEMMYRQMKVNYNPVVQKVPDVTE